MSVTVLNAIFQPFEEKETLDTLLSSKTKKLSSKILPKENLPSEAFITGELSSGWRYCIKGIRDPHEEWFFKTQRHGTEEDLMPDEVLSILKQLTSFLPNEIPL